ncbi:MAG: amidohydrolase [Sphingobacteriales bacterium]|nr:MAG: amidohydrolase [Sphingobacteriales bacterium]
MINLVKEKAAAYFEEIKEIRHHIHANPELSFQEHNTAAYISGKLTEWGIAHETGVAGTGVVAMIAGKNPGSRCIALRADMDALPIHEANDISYRSQNDGVMHACGHDVHSSCLLGTARILHDLRDQFEGSFKLIFQQGEEKHPGGASLLIKAGVLQDPKPDAIFALHVYPHLPSGTAGFRAGQYMASADEIYITIEGRGGHAALPHQTVDPITIAAQVITALQQVISRKGNPLIPSVLTFGKIAGGFATNVIPDKVEILGTLRTMDEKWRYEAHQWIKEITTSICESFGAKAEVEIPVGYPSLFNDPHLTLQAENWAREYVGIQQVHTLDMRMAAEDFSFYTLEVPGCFFRIGTSRNGQEFTAPVHNAKFNIDENALETGVGLFSWIALNALKSS